ncbi:MAG: DUF5110 domain-containing protein [Muribaculaceae bacterium]|nr:DUF5110 domain-containing protein [Muribaculaceae bacterium]
MKLKTIIALFALTAGGMAYAAVNHTIVENDSMKVTVDFISDNVVRLSSRHVGDKAKSQPTLVADLDKAGFKAAEVSEKKLRGGKKPVLITKSNLQVLYDSDDNGLGFGLNNELLLYTKLKPSYKEMSLMTAKRCSFYGGGERGYTLNLAGDTLVNYNKQNYAYTEGDPRIRQMGITMPYVVSSAGYAVFFDDFCASKLALTNGKIDYSTESDADIDIYIIVGTMESIVSDFTRLVGRQDLAPFWTLGYITSRYGYHDRKETEAVVDSLKADGYPVDGMVFDLYWYGKEQDMGRLVWDEQQWPNHKEMLANLKKRGINTVTISQPYILRNGRAVTNYNELAPKGLFCYNAEADSTQEVTIWVGHGGMFDVSNPDTQQWLRNRYKTLTDEGVTGWWGDLGEPEVHPETIVHHNGLTARQYHNLYGNDWSKIIYDLFRDEYPDRRLMTMMRAGTAGLQRYSVFPWSTDVSRSWGGLQPQVKIMVNSGLSGLGYMSHDVGGFAVDPANPRDDELYVRWLELGLFSPILRTHAQYLAEPYNYKDYSHIIKRLIQERYRWLPYNYTLAYENASKGLPFVRPLGFYDRDITAYDNISDQYLWGRDIMVAPILSQGAKSRSITFPEGNWIDFYHSNDDAYKGGTTITYDAGVAEIPVFVRAGAIIVRADYDFSDDIQNVGSYNPDKLEVNYFPEKGKSEGYIFEDDRTSTRTIENGQHRIIRFKADNNLISTTIEITAEGSFKGASKKKELTFRIPTAYTSPREVKLNGKNVKFYVAVTDTTRTNSKKRHHLDESVLIFKVNIKDITKKNVITISK